MRKKNRLNSRGAYIFVKDSFDSSEEWQLVGQFMFQ